MGGGWPLLSVWIFSGQPCGIQVAGVLIVVAVEAQHLPVTAIRRIILEIVVFVMNGQFVQVLAGEITAATGADPRQDFQCLFPVFYFFHSVVPRKIFRGYCLMNSQKVDFCHFEERSDKSLNDLRDLSLRSK